MKKATTYYILLVNGNQSKRTRTVILVFANFEVKGSAMVLILFASGRRVTL